MKKLMLITAATLALAGCQTVGGPGSGAKSYYDCGGGSRLKVTIGKRGAAMQIDRGRTMLLRQVTSIGGSTYEGFGYTLRLMGSSATWTGPTREAPHQCRQVGGPR